MRRPGFLFCGCDLFRFSLGAVRDPGRYYGGPETHGWYRVTVRADGRQVPDTDWLNGYETVSYLIDVENAWEITFEAEQTYGGNYDPDQVNYTLNMAMYDTEFVKTNP